jgi:hypothetical protein
LFAFADLIVEVKDPYAGYAWRFRQEGGELNLSVDVIGSELLHTSLAEAGNRICQHVVETHPLGFVLSKPVYRDSNHEGMMELTDLSFYS